jgi:hypothetical protein
VQLEADAFCSTTIVVIYEDSLQLAAASDSSTRFSTAFCRRIDSSSELNKWSKQNSQIPDELQLFCKIVVTVVCNKQTPAVTKKPPKHQLLQFAKLLPQIAVPPKPAKALKLQFANNNNTTSSQKGHS